VHQGVGEQDKCQLAREFVKFMRSRTDEATFETSGLPIRFTGNIKTGGGARTTTEGRKVGDTQRRGNSIAVHILLAIRASQRHWCHDVLALVIG
jgi:hypothetical protein